LKGTSDAPHRTFAVAQDTFYVIPQVSSNVPYTFAVARCIFSALPPRL
jgi:hypothetical protein